MAVSLGKFEAGAVWMTTVSEWLSGRAEAAGVDDQWKCQHLICAPKDFLDVDIRGWKGF